MNDDLIIELAQEAELPEGWYEGPWFDDAGNLRVGLPDCLRDFVNLIIIEVTND